MAFLLYHAVIITISLVVTGVVPDHHLHTSTPTPHHNHDHTGTGQADHSETTESPVTQAEVSDSHHGHEDDDQQDDHHVDEHDAAHNATLDSQDEDGHDGHPHAIDDDDDNRTSAHDDVMASADHHEQHGGDSEETTGSGSGSGSSHHHPTHQPAPPRSNTSSPQTPTSPKERNDSMQTAEGLVCFACHGNYELCGRKQISEEDPVKVCDMGHSCIVGRTGTGEAADEFSMYTSQQKLGQEGDGQDSSYVYFRDCFHETCGLEMEELHCMRVGLNVTCQRCCARNHCNSDAFNSGTGLSAHPRHPHRCLALLLLLTFLAFA